MGQLIAALAASQLNRTLFHFTDTRNLDSIAQHGLLSLVELERQGIHVPAPGGNDWSHDADRRVGMDHYVHLCLMSEHPMEFVARQDGRIQESVFIRVSSAVLNMPGILATSRVANEAGVRAMPLADVEGEFDLEVIYRRTDWRDPDIRDRRSVAKKYEILVPDRVDPKYLRWNG